MRARDQERRLAIRYTLATPCTPGLDRAEVREYADRVRITLHQKPRPKKALECVQVLVEATTTVRLERPLGSRTVIDGSTGHPVHP